MNKILKIFNFFHFERLKQFTIKLRWVITFYSVRYPPKDRRTKLNLDFENECRLWFCFTSAILFYFLFFLLILPPTSADLICRGNIKNVKTIIQGYLYD